MDLSFLLSILVTLVVAGLVFYLLFWFIGYVGLPAPFDKVARVVLALFAVIFLLSLLIGGAGMHPWLGNWPHR